MGVGGAVTTLIATIVGTPICGAVAACISTALVAVGTGVAAYFWTASCVKGMNVYIILVQFSLFLRFSDKKKHFEVVNCNYMDRYKKMVILTSIIQILVGIGAFIFVVCVILNVTENIGMCIMLCLLCILISMLNLFFNIMRYKDNKKKITGEKYNPQK